jgi:hypothetical protein
VLSICKYWWFWYSASTENNTISEVAQFTLKNEYHRLRKSGRNKSLESKLTPELLCCALL